MSVHPATPPASLPRRLHRYRHERGYCLAEALCSLLLLSLGLASLTGVTAVSIGWLREQLEVAALARSASEHTEVTPPTFANIRGGAARAAP